MSEVKLSDQLGAMAIIDSLYQQQIALEEHLNLPQLQEKIAQRIREYYQSQGMNIDQTLIDKGVEAWFADRLRFQTPRRSGFQRFLAKWYIRRRRIGSALAGCVLALGGAGGGYYFYHAHEASESLTQFTAQQQIVKSASDKLSGYRTEAEALSRKTVHYATSPVKVLKSQAETQLSGLDNAIAVASNSIAGLNTNALSQEQLFTLTQNAAAVSERQNTLATLLTEWKTLSESDSRLYQLAGDAEFKTNLTKFSGLNALFSQASTSLSLNKASAASDVNAVVAASQKAIELNEKLKQLDQRLAGFKSLRLSQKDMATVNAQAQGAREAWLGLNISEGEQYWTQLEYLDQLARTPLQLRIVDRAGEKSGVQRTYDNSSGNSWYFVVEAVKTNGAVFPIKFTDKESGRTVTSSTFAIRTTRTEYERLRNDKMEDGHIDNAIVGSKPAGALQFSYTRSITDEMIAEW